MWIKERIDTEYRKHKKLEWSKIAEQKILSQLKEMIDELDLEFAIATNVIEKETGKKVDLPKGMEELMDHYWRYVFSRLKQRIIEGSKDE